MAQAYDASRYVSDRTIDSHVRRVRRKFADLAAHPIETVHGIGYKLGPVKRRLWPSRALPTLIFGA